MRVRLTGDAGEKLKEVRKVVSDERRTVSRIIGIEVQKGIQSNIRRGRDASGAKWPDLKYRNGKPLQDTGRLRNSITWELRPGGVRVGTNVIYAAVHNFGAVIKPKRAKFLAIPVGGGSIRLVKSVTIPQREYAYVSDKTVDRDSEAVRCAAPEDRLVSVDLVSTRPITAAIVAQLAAALSVPVADAADTVAAERARKANEAVFVIYGGDRWNEPTGNAQFGLMSWEILIMARSLRGPRSADTRVGTGSLDLAEAATEALIGFDPVDDSGAHEMWVESREPYLAEDEALHAMLCRFSHEISLEEV